MTSAWAQQPLITCLSHKEGSLFSKLLTINILNPVDGTGDLQIRILVSLEVDKNPESVAMTVTKHVITEN